MELRFTAKILQNGDMDAAYIGVPYDIKAIYGKGRLLVHALLNRSSMWKRILLSAFGDKYKKKVCRYISRK